ncbi:MAG: zinc ribbon domain-containing protein [Bacteroidaceae bacterium]
MAREKAKDVADMPVEQKLKNLYSLQTKLTEIDRIRTLRGELPLEVQDLEDEIEGLTTRIEKLNNDIVSLQKQIAERKGNIEVNNTNIARFKEQTLSVRNNREYDNLSKQIEYAELDNQLNEKKINEAKAEMESKAQDVTRCSQLVQERRTDLDIKKSELDEIITETKAEEEKLREDAKNLECTIEPRLLSAFKRIRKNSRNGLGVVYVERDACGGCFNKIPPQRQLDIRMRKKIIVCEYCGRIMVDPELAGISPIAKAEDKPKRRRTIRKKGE